MRDPAAVFASVFRRIKPRTALPEVRVAFRPFANLNSTVRLDAGRLDVRISDMLESAPDSVLEALAFILICKLYRQPIPPRYRLRYNRFVSRRDVRRQVQNIRQLRGRKQVLSPAGSSYNLEEIFQELNARFFNSLLGMPQLTWSRTRSRVRLGHFDPTHNTIVVSQLLDSPLVPRIVVEYLLYHEMLHLKYPVEHCGTRRKVHSAEFQREEKAFPHYEEARKSLERLL